MGIPLSLEQINALIERHYSGASRRTSSVPRMRLILADEPPAPWKDVLHPVLYVVASGVKEIAILGERPSAYGPGSYLVTAFDLPMVGRITETPFRAVALEPDTRVLTQLVLDEASVPGREARGGPSATRPSVGASSPEFLDALLRLLRLLDSPTDIPVLAPLIERELLYRLLGGEFGHLLRQVALNEGPMARIADVVRWIRTHYAEQLRIDDAAELASMSLASLHRHFKAATSLTPLEFQKRLRLQEAQRRLVAGDGTAASVGASVGYASPSQFSREYARLFGTPPGRDLARLRELAAG